MASGPICGLTKQRGTHSLKYAEHPPTNKDKPMKLSRLAMLAGCVACASTLSAQEDPFKASIALGYVGTTGNTETTSFNTELLMTLSTENWTHNGKFQGLGAQENDVTTAERYF